ncbi:MAG: nucleoside-diphosphate kinase [Candidatus Krumholzibacteriia bacterium]
MSDTYLMIKPEVVRAGDQKIGAILELVQRSGFRIRNLALRRLDRALAGEFYAVHRERPFYGALVEYIVSGSVVCVHLAREDAVPRLRELVGATNPREAAAGTLRFLYGTSLQENAVHASDSDANAAREIGLVFGPAAPESAPAA